MTRRKLWWSLGVVAVGICVVPEVVIVLLALTSAAALITGLTILLIAA